MTVTTAAVYEALEKIPQRPPSIETRGEPEYDKLLAGTSARATLDTLGRVFEAVISSDRPRP